MALSFDITLKHPDYCDTYVQYQDDLHPVLHIQYKEVKSLNGLGKIVHLLD